MLPHQGKAPIYLPDSGGVLDCGSQFTILISLSFDGPSFDAVCACVPPYISLQVHIVPSFLPRSLCGWPHKSFHLLVEGQNHPIVRFAYLCTRSAKSLSFLPSFTSSFLILEQTQEVLRCTGRLFSQSQLDQLLKTIALLKHLSLTWRGNNVLVQQRSSMLFSPS